MLANPFKPTAGKTPPVIIGREMVVEEFIEGIENGSGAPGRLMRISGVRGTGKTVLLGEMAKIAGDLGWQVINEVATEGLCQRVLDRLLPEYRVQSIEAAPSALGARLGSIKLERVGPTLYEAIRRAIEKNGHGLIFTLDEVQDAAIDEVRVLAIAVQQAIGDDLDIAFVFAGLPSMIDDVINGKTLTFLRRALPFELKAVNTAEVADSLAQTMRATGLDVDENVAGLLASASRGYPFLIQLVGYYAWQLARRAQVGVLDTELAERGVLFARERFESTVIEPALQRVSRSGIEFLLAMAEDGGAPSKTGRIGERLGKTARQMSTVRARLIADSLVEAPSYGVLTFAIPYMDEYLNGHREELTVLIG